MIKKIAICLFGVTTALALSGCIAINIGSGQTPSGGGNTRGNPEANPEDNNNTPPSIEHHPQPPGENPGTQLCGAFCNYVFFNKNGQGYTASDASYEIELRYGSDTGPVIPNTAYHLYFYRTAQDKGCANNVGSNRKSFVSTATKKYVFTVYFITDFCDDYYPNDVYLLPFP